MNDFLHAVYELRWYIVLAAFLVTCWMTTESRDAQKTAEDQARLSRLRVKEQNNRLQAQRLIIEDLRRRLRLAQHDLAEERATNGRARLVALPSPDDKTGGPTHG
jgi:hypothetical protein